MVPIDNMLGALVGLFVGDAAGATLEFMRQSISEDLVRKAMTMPGGGFLHVGKGQITDDGELALAMMHALISVPSSYYPLESVAHNYVMWYASNPFDMGMTCRRAFGAGIGSHHKNISDALKETASQYNMESEANGALMRLAPLAVWAYQRSYEEVAEYARLDATLSHPNDVTQECNAAYAVALVHLLKHPKDSQGAIHKATQFITTPKVLSWMEHAKEPKVYEKLDCLSNIGHVRWAFTLAFHFLYYEVDFEDAIAKTLRCGGDTDTNAAIVGGLLGALHGLKNIPTYMVQPVLEFDCTKEHAKGHVRPSLFSVSSSLAKINQWCLSCC